MTPTQALFICLPAHDISSIRATHSIGCVGSFVEVGTIRRIGCYFYR